MASDIPPPPGLQAFRALVREWPIDRLTEYLLGLFRRRQIRGPKSCALATAWLLRKVVSTTKANEPSRLIYKVQETGKKLINAAPFELSVANVVRRVLGAIREEGENRDNETPGSSEFGSIPPTPGIELASPSLSTPARRLDMSQRPTLLSQQTQTARPVMTSMFSIMQHPTMRGQADTMSPRSNSPTSMATSQILQPQSDLKAEVLEAITEIIDELDQADEIVAGYALEHIIPQETILTYGTSSVLQRFLTKAASKRKFTLIQAEAYPNTHKKTYATTVGQTISDDQDLDTEEFAKPLIAQGINVILIPDSAVFAVMSRANKVLISATAVLSNGSLVAPAGTNPLLTAAHHYRIPVICLAESYKLSPVYPYDPFEFTDYGDTQQVIPYQDRELMLGLSAVRNPTQEWVGPDRVGIFVTNLGPVAAGDMYRTIRQQYHSEDLEL